MWVMESLVTIEWLADHLGDPDLLIFDCSRFIDMTIGHEKSGRPAYDREHIVGAAFLELQYDLSDPASEPLSADNPIVIMTGPLCGTLAPTASRTCLVSKSPHTGTIFETNVGGAFGPELKFAGFDGIIIKGRAEKPVYLWIHDGEGEMRERGAGLGGRAEAR